MKFSLGVLLLSYLLLSFTAFGEEGKKMKIYFFERPPYYIGKEAKVSGFLVDITKLILDEAKVQYEFKELPSKRILDDLKTPDYAMSIGWLKNKERESLYQFSSLIYQDEPYSIVIKSEKKNKIPAKPGIKDILENGMKLGMIDGFAYGQWLEDNIKKYNPKIEKFTAGDPDKPLKMLTADRYDYMIMSSEEAKYFIVNDESFKANLVSVKISDAPKGNERFLLFSKGVDSATMEKINLAIEKVKKSEAYKTITGKASSEE